jgi:hypothetical protein
MNLYAHRVMNAENEGLVYDAIQDHGTLLCGKKHYSVQNLPVVLSLLISTEICWGGTAHGIGLCQDEVAQLIIMKGPSQWNLNVYLLIFTEN